MHHAIHHCVANLCRKAGLNSDGEVVIPDLHVSSRRRSPHGRRGVETSRPGTLDDRRAHRRRKECDSRCSGRRLQISGERKATQIERPCASSWRGTLSIASTGLSLLQQLSWEAAIAKPSNGSPTRLVRQWCRELEPVLAFEAAEAPRAVHSALVRSPWCDRTDFPRPLKEPR